LFNVEFKHRKYLSVWCKLAENAIGMILTYSMEFRAQLMIG
jgi:hypothetical protein